MTDGSQPSQTLRQVLYSGDSIRLACKNCGAHQPVNISAMVNKHGPNSSFESVVRRWDCMFCGGKGDFTVFRFRAE